MTTPVILPDDDDTINDFLTYCSYRAQRYEFPDVTPERWGLIYGDWKNLEARFQCEHAEYVADTMKKLDSWIVGRGANA